MAYTELEGEPLIVAAGSEGFGRGYGGWLRGEIRVFRLRYRL